MFLLGDFIIKNKFKNLKNLFKKYFEPYGSLSPLTVGDKFTCYKMKFSKRIYLKELYLKKYFKRTI